MFEPPPPGGKLSIYVQRWSTLTVTSFIQFLAEIPQAVLQFILHLHAKNGILLFAVPLPNHQMHAYCISLCL